MIYEDVSILCLLFFVSLLLETCTFPLIDYNCSIEIGKKEGTETRTYNILLNSQFLKEYSITFDFDSDASDDLLTKSIWFHSAGEGDGSFVLFETLNTKLELYGKITFDTTYSRLEIKRDTI